MRSGMHRTRIEKSMVILKITFIAEVIKWGIRQNPFKGQLPRNTEVIMEKLNMLLPEFIETDNMRAFVSETIEQVPEIRDWNLSQVERERGVKVDDESRPPFISASRYDQPKPEYDFIDIDALKQNVTRSLEKEAQE
jgi:hypothetical protein